MPTKPKPAVAAVPAPIPKLFLVRCTFVGDDKKQQVEGSFRFVAEAPDAATVWPKVEKAVRKLRRTGEIPARCDVYVEFILELADLKTGIVADFERWAKDPRRFQSGCITFSATAPVYQTGHNEPSYRFGPAPRPPAAGAGPAVSGG